MAAFPECLQLAVLTLRKLRPRINIRKSNFRIRPRLRLTPRSRSPWPPHIGARPRCFSISLPNTRRRAIISASILIAVERREQFLEGNSVYKQLQEARAAAAAWIGAEAFRDIEPIDRGRRAAEVAGMSVLPIDSAARP
jgi:hypothetical protein